MKLIRIIMLTMLLSLGVTAALAGSYIASPEGVALKPHGEIVAPAVKAFGNPTDYKAAALAGADYLRYMQADVTEDNAGNGATDTDPDDAGWDWSTTAFEHSTTASPKNLYGVTANGLLQVYKFAPDPALWTALQDAADWIVAQGPTEIRSAADMLLLLDFADLPDVADPANYQAGALTIWNYLLAQTTNSTATEVAEMVRDKRAVTQNYPNGIIPWDIAPWAEGLMKLDAVFPGQGYAAQAAEMAEVLWQDSFNANPGYFEPHGHNKGADPTWANRDFWWYSTGVAGLIRAFAVTQTHLTEIPGLWNELLDCQYDDGAFSNQYGASSEFNDRDGQATAYCVWALHDNLPFAGATVGAFTRGVQWLAGWQDASGGFVYDDGTHYPEMGGECTAALAYGWTTMGAVLSATPGDAGPLACGETQTVTFAFDREEGTAGMRGYEVTLQVTGPVDAVTVGDFTDAGTLAALGNHYFRAIDNGDGTFTITDAVLGVTPGLLADAPLFTLDLVGNGDGQVDVVILGYKLRDPDNVPIFADVFGTDYMVDCTAPAAVAGITAAPHHDRVAVSWTHDGADTALYEVYRGLWYDTTVGVSAYPEYDDLPGNTIPTRPSSRAVAAASAEWVLAGTVPAGTTAFDDVFPDASTRGVYYYEVFAVDAADNGSLAAADNDRATNYWLGDVNADGFVDAINDITALGACFATTPLDVGVYNPLCDVGPTDDWSRVGIPLTDNVIDFEDLMIFSMNFSVVSDINKTGVTGGASASLAWVRLDEDHYALRLVQGNGLKGVRVRAMLPDGVSVVVEAGSLLAEQGQQVFFRNVGSGLDANLAVLGLDAVLTGQGDLLTIRTSADLTLADLAITLRDADNAEMEFNLDGSGAVVTPRAFRLEANYPNPFNPVTKISFSLPEAQRVQLAVFSLDGRKVATLVNETRPAGRYEVTWTGRDDAGRLAASGTYFYRIDAGPYSQVRKMTLMK